MLKNDEWCMHSNHLLEQSIVCVNVDGYQAIFKAANTAQKRSPLSSDTIQYTGYTYTMFCQNTCSQLAESCMRVPMITSHDSGTRKSVTVISLLKLVRHKLRI